MYTGFYNFKAHYAMTHTAYLNSNKHSSQTTWLKIDKIQIIFRNRESAVYVLSKGDMLLSDVIAAEIS
jgi:hypothetical protein